MNLRSRLHVFGYGAQYATVSAMGSNVKLPTWTPTAYTADTQDKFPSDSIFTDYKYPTDGTKFPTSTVSTQSNTDSKFNYAAYVIWQNPDVQGAVTYDGFEAKMYWELTPPLVGNETSGGGAWASESAMNAAPAQLKIKF